MRWKRNGGQHSDALRKLRSDLKDALLRVIEAQDALDPSEDIGKMVLAVSSLGKRLEDIEKSPLLKHGPDHYAKAIE